jgi:hypothetical protein
MSFSGLHTLFLPFLLGMKTLSLRFPLLAVSFGVRRRPRSSDYFFYPPFSQFLHFVPRSMSFCFPSVWQIPTINQWFLLIRCCAHFHHLYFHEDCADVLDIVLIPACESPFAGYSIFWHSRSPSSFVFHVIGDMISRCVASDIMIAWIERALLYCEERRPKNGNVIMILKIFHAVFLMRIEIR